MFFYVTFWLSVTTYTIVGGILFLVPVKLSWHESVIFCATTVKLEFWHQCGCGLPQPWPWPWCLAERISNTSDWNDLTGSCSEVKDLRGILTLHLDHGYYGDLETDPERAGWTTSPEPALEHLSVGRQLGRRWSGLRCTRWYTRKTFYIGIQRFPVEWMRDNGNNQLRYNGVKRKLFVSRVKDDKLHLTYEQQITQLSGLVITS